MEQAVALGLDVVRIPAVEGNTISSSEQLRYDSISLDHRVLSPRELGCLMSHLEVWRRIVAAGDPWSFVAEDDLHISKAASQFLAGSGWIPSGIDIVKAETFLDPVTLSNQDINAPGGRTLKGLRSFHAGSAGYFISKDAAKVLLAFAEIHCEPADHFIFWPSGPRKHGLRIAQLDPAICVQDFLLDTGSRKVGFESTMIEERARFWNSDPRSRKLRGVARIPRELRRVAVQMANTLRASMPASLTKTVRKSVDFQ